MAVEINERTRIGLYAFFGCVGTVVVITTFILAINFKAEKADAKAEDVSLRQDRFVDAFKELRRNQDEVNRVLLDRTARMEGKIDVLMREK